MSPTVSFVAIKAWKLIPTALAGDPASIALLAAAGIVILVNMKKD